MKTLIKTFLVLLLLFSFTIGTPKNNDGISPNSDLEPPLTVCSLN